MWENHLTFLYVGQNLKQCHGTLIYSCHCILVYHPQTALTCRRTPDVAIALTQHLADLTVKKLHFRRTIVAFWKWVCTDRQMYLNFAE